MRWLAFYLRVRKEEGKIINKDSIKLIMKFGLAVTKIFGEKT